jgi:hypothetical protein
MRTLTKAILACALACLLAGCLGSRQPLLDAADSTQIFPARTLLLSDGEAYALRGTGAGYDVEGGGGTVTFDTMTFVRLPDAGPAVAIGRGRTTDGRFYYALIEVAGREARRYGFSADTYADAMGIRYEENGGDVLIDSDDGLLRIMQAVYRDRAQLDYTAFRIYDLDDGDQAAEAMSRIEELKAAQEATAAADEATAGPAPTEAGTWFYREELDPITDARKQFVFGQPASAEGVRDQPYIRIGCYADGMGITLYWGTALSDMYPDGDMDLADVSVRFDSAQAQHLGWAVSEDWSTTYPPNAAAGAVSEFGQVIINEILPGLVTPVDATWEPKAFHLAMLSSDRLVLRADTRGSGAATLVFDMAGYADVARSFRSSCM